MGKFKQAMHTVATKLSMPIINALSIKEQKRCFMEKDSRGRTHLHEIALNPGQAAFIKVALKAGVNLLVEDRDGEKHLV